MALSQNSLTRAKRTFTDRKPFFKPEVKRKKRGLDRLRAWRLLCEEQRQKLSKEVKTLAFRKILGLGVISRFLEVEETSPLVCNLVFSLKPFS